MGFGIGDKVGVKRVGLDIARIQGISYIKTARSLTFSVFLSHTSETNGTALKLNSGAPSSQ